MYHQNDSRQRGVIWVTCGCYTTATRTRSGTSVIRRSSVPPRAWHPALAQYDWATKSGNQQLQYGTCIWYQSLRAQQYIILKRSHGQVTKVWSQAPHITTEWSAVEMAMLPPPTKKPITLPWQRGFSGGWKKEEYAMPRTKGREVSYGKTGLTTLL